MWEKFTLQLGNYKNQNCEEKCQRGWVLHHRHSARKATSRGGNPAPVPSPRTNALGHVGRRPLMILLQHAQPHGALVLWGCLQGGPSSLGSIIS